MTDPVCSPDSPAFAAAKRAQAAAANPIESAWVEANAGSGKTKVLIDRVARLLLGPDGLPGARPDSILCITYTKAAANEMLSRLYARLGGWAVATDESLRNALATLEDRDPSLYSDDDFREARRLFARALETPGGLRIETIHAFCARLLRQFPLEAGVSPSFVAIEEDEAEQLWQTVLNEQMENAAANRPEAMAVLAEATGGLGIAAALDALKYKRSALTAFNLAVHSETELTRRILASSGASGASSSAIIAAAMDEALPVQQLSIAIELLTQMDKPGKSDLSLLDGLQAVLSTECPEERYQFYMGVLAGAKRNFPSGSNPFTAKAAPFIVDLFSRNQKSGVPEGTEITRMKQVQSAMKAAQLAERSIALMRIGLPLVEAYTAAKIQRGALDFDDLIAHASSLLTQSNAAEWVLYKLDGGLTHLLLDEAQDTSPPQWQLINALVAEFQSGLGRDHSGGSRTQFVVGDPKQSIYSFQGADEAKFKSQRAEFVRREEVIATANDRNINLPEMAMSFRSTPEVLRFVDVVRAHAPLDDASTDTLPPRAADIVAHTARRSNQPGRVELWPLEMPTPKDGDESAWTTPTDHVPADAPRRRLARKVAIKVKQMLNRGETIWTETADRRWAHRPVRPEDILILVRSRNELFESLIDSLKQQDVPVAGADRLRLLDNLGVQDCLNLIRFVLQPSDDLTLAEILRGPFCGLVDDDRHLFVLAHGRMPDETLWSRLSSNVDETFRRARSFCESLLDRQDLPAFEFLQWALTTRDEYGLSGWDKLIQRLGEPVRDPVQALVSSALSYDLSEAKSLVAFLARMESQETILKRELGEPEGAVRVMTVHGAKGLQAPVVFLPDTTGATKPVSDALFITDDGTPLYSPSRQTDTDATSVLREDGDIAAERESRRLLYVALTRAADRLIIAGAGGANTKDGYAKSSWYRWCQSAMLELCGQEEPLEPGDEPLNFGPAPVTMSIEKSSEPSRRIGPQWLTQLAQTPEPPLRLAAPSRLAEDRAPVLQPFGQDRKAALRRGRLIHGLLQVLPEVPAHDQFDVARKFLSRAPDLRESEIDEMISASFQTLQDSAFRDIFAAGGRSEAAIVGTLKSGQMVNGRVDRLIIQPDHVLIIDYKTDRPAPFDASGVEMPYWVQMAAYRAVLQSLYPDRPIRCALLYTDGPRLIELQADKLSDSLNRVESRV